MHAQHTMTGVMSMLTIKLFNVHMAQPDEKFKLLIRRSIFVWNLVKSNQSGQDIYNSWCC